MAELEGTESHKVFLIERKGDTLIVAPKGDLIGFSGTDFHIEADRLLELIAEPETAIVIVDFSNSNYFGSEMIGVINSLAIKTRELQKHFAVCDVSQDMTEGLKIMKVESLWNLYNSRKAALEALTTETFSQQIKAKSKLLTVGAVVLFVALMVWLFAFQPLQNVDQHYYDTFMDVYKQLQETRSSRPSVAQWNAFRRPADRQLRLILLDLELSADPNAPAKQYLLSAGHNGLMEMLKEDRDQSTAKAERLFEEQMAEAKKWIDGDADARPMPKQVVADESPQSENSEEARDVEAGSK